MLSLNDLLKKAGIEPAEVLLLRHTPRKTDGQLRNVLPGLAVDDPRIFNAYQQTQPPKVEASMRRAKYVASFIGLENNKERIAHPALFVGLFKMGSSPKKLTFKIYWKKKENQKLKEFGMRGFVRGSRKSVLWFDLKPTKIFQNWKGKLIIGWPAPAITYARFANKGEFPIGAIMEESLLHRAMPDWKEFIWTWAQLHELPSRWQDALRHWRGIYYISDRSDGKAYVGSAYGRQNIFKRWEDYRKTGHGGNVHLRKRRPENLTFSILERVSPDMPKDEVREYEQAWKKRLHTFWPKGLNAN